jgi:hypothetical protein
VLFLIFRQSRSWSITLRLCSRDSSRNSEMMAPFGSWGVHTLIRPSLPHNGGGGGWDGGTKHRGVVACQGFLGSCCPDSLLELETKRTLDVEINSFPNKNWYVLGENFTPNKFAAIYKQSGSGIPKLLLHNYLKLKPPIIIRYCWCWIWMDLGCLAPPPCRGTQKIFLYRQGTAAQHPTAMGI